MCPESLHVYRRMGTQEHEASTRRASSATVDVIQAGNAPRVSADEGYSLLASSLQGARGNLAQQEYELVRAAVSKQTPGVRPPATGQPAAPPAVPTSPLLAPCLARASPPTTPLCDPLPIRSVALVKRSAWPHDDCSEFNGAGWAVRVCSSTRFTALVSFVHARAPSGLEYEPVRVPTSLLRQLAIPPHPP